MAQDEKSGEVIKLHPSGTLMSTNFPCSLLEMWNLVFVIGEGDKSNLVSWARSWLENADVLDMYTITGFLIGFLQVSQKGTVRDSERQQLHRKIGSLIWDNLVHLKSWLNEHKVAATSFWSDGRLNSDTFMLWGKVMMFVLWLHQQLPPTDAHLRK